jgi:hypothetical protein
MRRMSSLSARERWIGAGMVWIGSDSMILFTLKQRRVVCHSDSIVLLAPIIAGALAAVNRTGLPQCVNLRLMNPVDPKKFKRGTSCCEPATHCGAHGIAQIGTVGKGPELIHID